MQGAGDGDACMSMITTNERTAEAEAVGAEDEALVRAFLWASDVARRTTLVGAGGLVVALVAEPSGSDGDELARRLGTGLQPRPGGGYGSGSAPPRRRRHAARRQRQERHGHHHHQALDKTSSHGACR